MLTEISEGAHAAHTASTQLTVGSPHERWKIAEAAEGGTRIGQNNSEDSEHYRAEAPPIVFTLTYTGATTMTGTTQTTSGNPENGGQRRVSLWRIAGWSAAALALLFPLVAMQLTDDVNWTVGDFAFAAVLLLSVGIPLELTVRKTGDAAYRAAVGTALLTAFFLIWANGAVGIIGSEGNAVNLLYYGVLAVGLLGALLARFRPHGMARAMFATALAQTAVVLGALVAGLGATAQGGAYEIAFLNGFFVALWLGSALLFRQATDDTIPTTLKKLKVHATLSALTLVIGVMILTFMISLEGEPGALPLLLVVVGIVWYLVTRARIRSYHE